MPTLGPVRYVSGASRAETSRITDLHIITDGAGSDRLTGGGGDKLAGQAGRDILDGLGGNDSLRGGTGADRPTGNAGNDRLAGGAGADVFVFSGGAVTA